MSPNKHDIQVDCPFCEQSIDLSLYDSHIYAHELEFEPVDKPDQSDELVNAHKIYE